MSTIYDVGDVALLRAVLTDKAGAAVDPATLTIQITAPSGTVTSYVYGTHAQVAKLAAGDYEASFTCAESGKHAYVWIATGTKPGREPGSFYVRG